MRRTAIGCGLLIVLQGAGAAAVAQTVAPSPPAPAPAPASSAPTVKSLTVTGTPPPVRPSIDRRSYDITKDLNATTGTVADVLRNVPALSVDLQGNVSIRGDSNVVIMVDGQPSTLFTGAGRSQALQSVPADEFERVEVITNPSAAFSPEGSGGIVNLISKKTRKPGRSGSVRVNADATGRWNAGFNASQKTDKLTLSINAGVRRDLQSPTTVETRDGFATPTTPAFTSLATTVAPSRGDSWNLRGGADYDPDTSTHMSASLQFIGVGNRTSFDTQTVEHDQSGTLDQILDRSGVTDNNIDYVGLQTSLKRNFSGDDNDLTVSLGLHRSKNESESPFADVSEFPAARRVR